LPRTGPGQCGTVLFVASAPSMKILSMGAGSVALLLHLALGRLFTQS
jgi:hypothetical protein